MEACPFVRNRLDAERSAEAFGSFFHGDEPDVAVVFLVGVEPGAVVGDGDVDRFGARVEEACPAVACLRMLVAASRISR